MKKIVKIIKPVQSYEVGKTYRLHGSFVNSLIKRGKAEEVLPKVEPKEEKKVIETKEEKHAPETTKQEPKETLSINKLSAVISEYSIEDLKFIIENDTRIGAKKLAQAELDKR